MTSTGYHDTGEEWVTKNIYTEEVAKPASITVGLYDDSTDALVDGSTLADITTEPNDGNYARLTYTFGTTDFSAQTDANTQWFAQFATKQYDLTDTTGTVDSYFVVISFQAENESSVNDHLLFTENLDVSNPPVDLSNYNAGDFDGGIALN